MSATSTQRTTVAVIIALFAALAATAPLAAASTSEGSVNLLDPADSATDRFDDDGQIQARETRTPDRKPVVRGTPAQPAPPNQAQAMSAADICKLLDRLLDADDLVEAAVVLRNRGVIGASTAQAAATVEPEVQTRFERYRTRVVELASAVLSTTGETAGLADLLQARRLERVWPFNEVGFVRNLTEYRAVESDLAQTPTADDPSVGVAAFLEAMPKLGNLVICLVAFDKSTSRKAAGAFLGVLYGYGKNLYAALVDRYRELVAQGQSEKALEQLKQNLYAVRDALKYLRDCATAGTTTISQARKLARPVLLALRDVLARTQNFVDRPAEPTPAGDDDELPAPTPAEANDELEAPEADAAADADVATADVDAAATADVDAANDDADAVDEVDGPAAEA